MSLQLTAPCPWPQGPGEGRFEAGGISHEASRTGTVLSCSAVRALFGKDVLILFHPLSTAVSCLQAFGRQVCEIGAIVGAPPPPVGPSPTGMCSSIHHAVLDPFVGQPTPIQWHLGASAPCQLPHLSFYFWDHSRTGMGCINQAPLRGGEGGEGRGGP